MTLEPAQVLSGEVPLQRKQLRAGRDVTAALEEEARIPLDPSKEGGVMRATLLEPAANGKHEAVLALTLHAVAGEEPSMQLLQSQLLTVYESAKSGGAAGLKPGLQFRDVLHWLSERQNKGVHPALSLCKSLYLVLACRAYAIALCAASVIVFGSLLTNRYVTYERDI